MGIGSSIKAFAKTLPGYIVLMAIICALGGLSLGALGIPVGAIILLALGFGLPIYFGWNTNLRKFLSVALCLLLFGTLFTGIVATASLLTPSGLVSSNDGVLTNATVTPFESTAAHPVFNLSVDAHPLVDLKDWLRLEMVYVWVTNCEADTNSSRGNCYLAPASVFLNETYKLTPGPNGTQNRSLVPISWQISGLPQGQVYFFIVFTAIAAVNASSVWYYSLDGAVGGWSCTVPPDYSSCFWATGPVPASWGQVYVLLLVDDFVSTALVVAVLVSIILIYAYLKGRERARKEKARAAAGGEVVGPSTGELRCPHCNAVVEKGETICWKCKKDLSSPPSSKSEPLASSSSSGGDGSGPSPPSSSS